MPARAPERLDTLDELAAGWLMRFGRNTRDAYARDLRSWIAWCDEIGVDPLYAGLHHADAYNRWLSEIATTRTGGRLAPSSVNRRISALASFYRYCVRQRALTESPLRVGVLLRPEILMSAPSGCDRWCLSSRPGWKAAPRYSGQAFQTLSTTMA